MTRCLQTTGQGYFEEVTYDNPPIFGPTDIYVKSVMTGVCRSDIDMMLGNFGPLPLNMQGHEGLAQVIAVGNQVTNIKSGDYVATRGEPAYADSYHVREHEYVKVPEAHPRYILEPVACGINLIDQAKVYLDLKQGVESKMIILGSGFLAWVAYHTMRLNGFIFQVDVLGSSNLDLWKDKLLLGTTESYDVVVDISGKYDLGADINLNNNALVIDAVGKPTNKKEAEHLLWKACTTIRPSPRNPEFINCMHYAKHWIENGYLEVDHFWTRGYNRDTEWQQAFADGKDRPDGYSRGYIKWD